MVTLGSSRRGWARRGRRSDVHRAPPGRRWASRRGFPCCGEDVAEEEPELFAVDLAVGVVGTDQLGRAFDCGPLPAGPDDHRDGGVGSQMVEFAGSAPGHEPDRAGAGDRVGKHTGVHDSGVWGVVGAERYDDAEAVVEGYQVCEGCQIGHATTSIGSTPLAWRQPFPNQDPRPQGGVVRTSCRWGYSVPATPMRFPSGSVSCPTTRVPGVPSGPMRRLPPRLSALVRAASTSGTWM